jgi:hypothetical protein
MERAVAQLLVDVHVSVVRKSTHVLLYIFQVIDSVLRVMFMYTLVIFFTRQILVV